MKVYWSSVEYLYNDKSEGLIGGMVYVFIYAKDARAALEKIEESVLSQKLTPIEYEFISPYEDVSWDSTSDEENYSNLYEEALRKKGEVIFDDYYAYESED